MEEEVWKIGWELTFVRERFQLSGLTGCLREEGGGEVKTHSTQTRQGLTVALRWRVLARTTA